MEKEGTWLEYFMLRIMSDLTTPNCSVTVFVLSH